MFDDPATEAVLNEAARRNGTDARALRAALEHTSPADLALVLGVPIGDAHERLERVQRVLAFGGDWGAGCRLLSDEVRAELLAALQA